jgi:hypothetical protein
MLSFLKRAIEAGSLKTNRTNPRSDEMPQISEIHGDPSPSPAGAHSRPKCFSSSETDISNIVGRP